MIAGQNPQAAGIERQRIVNAELSTEISNRILLRDLR
jgi:hypothetical protein